MFFWKKRNYAISDFQSGSEETKLQLYIINTKEKNAIIDRLRKNFHQIGKYSDSGGQISESIYTSILAQGAAALGLSAFNSKSLFIATADPSTLMKIGQGVGSAVMGGGKIIAQAPFLPISGALLPVIAPIVILQALSTIKILKALKKIEQQINELKQQVRELLIRNEATKVGEIISSINIVDSIEDEIAYTNIISMDLVIRLALVESKIEALFERYRLLSDGDFFNSNLPIDHFEQKSLDACAAVILSIYCLKINRLRLSILLQHNPYFLADYSKNLCARIENIDTYLKSLEIIEEKLETSKERTTLKTFDWWQRNMPAFINGRREERHKLENKIRKLDKARESEPVHNLFDNIKLAQEYINQINDSPSNTSIVCWEDESGKHCVYTDEIYLE